MRLTWNLRIVRARTGPVPAVTAAATGDPLVVDGRGADGGVSGHHPLPLVGLVLAAVLAVVAATDPGAPDTTRLAGELRLPDDPPLWTPPGVWQVAGALVAVPTAAYRIPGGYLLVTTRGPVVVHDDADLEPLALPGRPRLAGVASSGDTVVAYGDLDGRPARPGIWVRGRAAWRWRPGPEMSEISAVSWDGAKWVAIGRASDDGRRVRAESPDARRWQLSPDESPADPVAADRGFLTYGRDSEGNLGYLHSPDGVEWRGVGSHLVRPVGLPAIVSTIDGAATVTLVGSGISFAPPAWPVTSLWATERAIWLTTPGSVWWSPDGRGWTSTPLDEGHGFVDDSPWLLPLTGGPVVLGLDDGRTRVWSWASSAGD